MDTQPPLPPTPPLVGNQSRIGRKYRETPFAAISLATVTITLDFAIISQHLSGDVRACLALVVFALTIYVTDGDYASIGLCFTPSQGWSSWAYLSLKLAGIVGVCIAGGLGVWSAMGHELHLPMIPPTQAFQRFLDMCVVAPVVEEVIYRVVGCGLVAGILGDKTTILINGLLFGYLHVLYGNPSPENLVGGFILAWAYLKSETILLPVMLHSLGNALVFAGQLAGWYVLGGSG